MADKFLSPEEVEILRQSPYVESVSQWNVRFTPEFKEIVYKERCAKIPIRTILRNHGIDPDILGTYRLGALVRGARNYAESGSDLVDVKKKENKTEEIAIILPKGIPQQKAEKAADPSSEDAVEGEKTLSERISDLEKEIREIKELVVIKLQNRK